MIQLIGRAAVTTNLSKKFHPGQPNVYETPKAVAEVSRALRHSGRRVMLVPTMGALHDGHLALVRAAKRVPGSMVVVSIFVNPLQFGAGEDLGRYPRTMEADLDLLRAEGIEVVFAPGADVMYPDGTRTSVQPGPLGAELEGASRPTHFAGMLTVVLKLLHIVAPDRVFFGEKDYQQLVLVRQMVADLNLEVRVVGRADRPGGGRARAVVAQPLPHAHRTRARRRTLGGAAGRDVCGARRSGRRLGRRPRGPRGGARAQGGLPRDPWSRT